MYSYVLYACVGLAKIHPAFALQPLTSIVLLPPFFTLLSIHFWRSVGLCLWGRYCSRLVPWKGKSQAVVQRGRAVPRPRYYFAHGYLMRRCASNSTDPPLKPPCFCQFPSSNSIIRCTSCSVPSRLHVTPRSANIQLLNLLR
jgi:hypothetical protein